SVISSTLSGTGYDYYAIALASGTEGTNGNQSISYLKMEGNMTAFGAILVERRSNVSIHHCTIQNFFSCGVTFVGAWRFTDNEATVKAKGNSVHDCTITNNADYPGYGKDPTGWGRGNVEIGSQKDMQIYNNTIVQSDRGADNNGFCIKYTGDGYCEGLKIYNNTITKPPYDGSTWDFAIELWNNRGGTQIYDNDIQGAIDFGGGGGMNNDAAGYGFMARVYNNNIGQSSLRSLEENGIYLERNIMGGTYIYNNNFKNLSKAVVTYPISGDVIEDVHIDYNIITGIQTLPSDGGDAVVLGGSGPVTFSNIQIDNNVILANAPNPSSFAIYYNFAGNASNITARNNIIEGFVNNPIYVNASGSISGCYIQNNLFYNNGSNTVLFGKTPSAPFVNDNLTSANPMFVSSTDYHLQPGSPALGAGIKVPGLTTDYAGNTVNDPPNVGIYESGSAAPPPVVEIPVYQKSAIENSTPAQLVMTYDMTLANIVPAATSFSVKVNSAARSVNSVSVSGTKVYLSLSSAVVAGDVVTVAYTKPSVNPLQTPSGGIAAGFTGSAVTNSVLPVNPPPESLSIKMTIGSNPVHNIVDIAFSYTGTPVAPQVLRILDIHGNMYVEKTLEPGIASIWFPINLNNGVYNVIVLSQGVQMAVQKIIVY
ncbi:MAG TPA: SwmB domain-containing protein, partial [Bacteroidales bacterium]|nr:SwmB domain-containing protein [Bacteroidales bacterium]